MSDHPDLDDATSIAIVGMAGRFPGADDVDALWELVRDGRDGLTDLSDDDLLAAGVDGATLASPDYVRRAGVLTDVECFDAAFFGIGARDVSLMDPQHRHFYECAWAALESAGHLPETFDGSIGVFGGCGHNTYLLHNLLTSPGLLDRLGWFLLRHTANDKDFLTTGVSYRLDLRGPSVNVQTACSTSLVAVHVAVQSLLTLDCDLALAGGATIEVPHTAGYKFHEGEILAPDGHCRAFDAQSAGTVLTSGVGVVALRRLADAVADGDPILAVIRGSAVNNDGARKVGYLAPSVDGHAAVVREALAVAGVDPSTVTLLEAHGTGTRVGDPIEVAALTAAFRDGTDATGFCRLTSTKPNIGHLDTAAGVASLIKVVQALRHRWLPPMAGYTGPSDLLDLRATPFVLSGAGEEWETGGRPRRAGVSSLGVGGTNAHVVVQEAPAQAPSDPAPGPHLLVVSGRTAAAAESAAQRLADHLDASGDDALLGDCAHTLLTGRRTFAHRRAVSARTISEAAERLRGRERTRLARAEATDGPLDVVFCFPGGGSQYAGMGGGLLVADRRFAVYRDVLEEGLAATEAAFGPDLRLLLIAALDGANDDERAAALRNPSVSLPAVFVVEVALARQLMAWGIRPRALVGHSLGEYAAAHLAGVLDLPDAVELVVRRAEMMERVSGWGATMATIALGEEDLRARLGCEVSLAAVNAADECVVSGPTPAVEALLSRLAADAIGSHRIPLSAAAHSSLLDPILPEFATAVRDVTLRPPALPYVSNLSGTWITPEQACDPDAWAAHLRGTVRFADGLATALAAGPAAVIEVGPGRSLTCYARRQSPAPSAAVATMRHAKDAVADDVHLLDTLGHLWAAGVEADWPALVTTPGRRRRVVLPTYPFERTRHWIEPGDHPLARPAPPAAAARPEPPVAERRPVSEWASEPTWTPLPALPEPRTTERWLVVADPDDTVAPLLAAALTAGGAVEVEIVGPDRAPAAAAGADAVAIVGAGPGSTAPETALAVARHRWLGTAVEVLRAAGERDAPRIGLVTLGAWALPGDEHGRAAEALAVGPAAVARAEYPHVRSSAIDLPVAPTAADVAAAAAELIVGNEPVVALRAGVRFGRDTTPCPLPPVEEPPVVVAPGSTWLVTGGLGAVGGAIAAHLARRGASLVVTSSAPLPDDAAAWRRQHGPGHPTTQRLDRLAALAGEGPVRVETCDVADPGAVRALLDRLAAEGVELAGVVHAAGVLADRALALLSADEIDPVLGAKALGALVLADELRRRRSPATLVLTSSTSTVLAPGGQTAYVAANSVLDALAHDRAGVRTITLQWGVWAGEGMAATAADRAASGLTSERLLDHPVLHELATDRSGTMYARGALRSSVWTIDQHRLAEGDVAVLPGTGAIELLLSALGAAGECGSGLGDVTLLAPLAVPNGATVPVRVVLDPSGRCRRAIRLDAAPNGDAAWRTFVEATVAPDAALEIEPVVPDDSGPLTTEVADLLALPRQQLRLGPRWEVATDARRGADESRATVDPPDLGEGWRFDPAVADVAIAAGVALLEPGGLWVPATAESVWAAIPAAPPHVVHARRRTGTPAGGDIAVIDLTVSAADGQPLVRIGGLTLHRVPSSAALAVSSLPPLTGEQPKLGGPLLALTLDGGIRASEGGEAFERALATGRSRLVVSSIALDALMAPVGDEPSVAGTSSSSGEQGTTIQLVTSVWEELLGVSPVGPDDDFFDLGGHSLIAVRVVAAIHRRMGVRLGLAALVETPTPAKLASAVDRAMLAAEASEDSAEGHAAAVRRPLVPVKATGSRRPFFVVHGAGGNVLNLWAIARHFPEERPLWGFQAHGNDRLEPPDSSIEAMATRYLEAMRCVQRHGPYLLGGYSGGGIVALELARQVAAAGERVDLIVLFDTYKPEFWALRPTEKLRNLVHNTRRTGFADTSAWLKEVVGKRVRPTTAPDSATATDELDMDMAQTFSDTVRRYTLSTYPVDVLQLRAKPVRPTLAHDYRWKGLVTGRIDEHDVAGDHNTMFSAEHAPSLAAVVVEALDEADRQ